MNTPLPPLPTSGGAHVLLDGAWVLESAVLVAAAIDPPAPAAAELPQATPEPQETITPPHRRGRR